jgi:F0F1-type ATP synthase membrane subunit b/b'
MKGVLKSFFIALLGIVAYKTIKPVTNAVDKSFEFINNKVDEIKKDLKKNKDEVEEKAPEKEN